MFFRSIFAWNTFFSVRFFVQRRTPSSNKKRLIFCDTLWIKRIVFKRDLERKTGWKFSLYKDSFFRNFVLFGSKTSSRNHLRDELKKEYFYLNPRLLCLQVISTPSTEIIIQLHSALCNQWRKIKKISKCKNGKSTNFYELMNGRRNRVERWIKMKLAK